MKKQAMTEGVLISQIEHLERQSSGYFSSEIATEQAMAMDYYLRRPFGTEEEGRSAVISSDVWDVVEGLTPVVLKPFVSTDDIVRFNPEGAEDEEAAEQSEAVSACKVGSCAGLAPPVSALAAPTKGFVSWACLCCCQPWDAGAFMLVQ